MWNDRGKGNRVSPDPWGDDDTVETETLEMHNTINSTDRKEKSGSRTKNGTMPVKSDKKREEFVYKRTEKKATAEHLDNYLAKRFNQNHAWRPNLTERKR